MVSSVQKERYVGNDAKHCARNVNLNAVVAGQAFELKVNKQPRVIRCINGLISQIKVSREKSSENLT